MKSVGVSIDRVDGIKKVTGQAKYVDDMKMARMLYAQVKRSPYAHAKILSIDTSEAEKLPGVKSVITGEYYKKRGGLYLEDKNFLAVGRPNSAARLLRLSRLRRLRSRSRRSI